MAPDRLFSAWKHGVAGLPLPLLPPAGSRGAANTCSASLFTPGATAANLLCKQLTAAAVAGRACGCRAGAGGVRGGGGQLVGAVLGRQAAGGSDLARRGSHVAVPLAARAAGLSARQQGVAVRC